MMDSVSVTASIATIIGLISSIGKGLEKLYRLRDAPEQVLAYSMRSPTSELFCSTYRKSSKAFTLRTVTLNMPDGEMIPNNVVSAHDVHGNGHEGDS